MLKFRSGFNWIQSFSVFKRERMRWIVWVRYDIEGRSSIQDLEEMRNRYSHKGSECRLKEFGELFPI